LGDTGEYRYFVKSCAGIIKFKRFENGKTYQQAKIAGGGLSKADDTL